MRMLSILVYVLLRMCLVVKIWYLPASFPSHICFALNLDCILEFDFFQSYTMFSD